MHTTKRQLFHVKADPTTVELRERRLSSVDGRRSAAVRTVAQQSAWGEKSLSSLIVYIKFCLNIHMDEEL